MSRTVLIFGISLALLLVALKWIEYQFFVRDLSLEMYIGIVGLFFTLFGSWIGWKLTRPKRKIGGEIPDSILVDSNTAEFNPDNTFGLSPREHEVLVLIAQGHSYQERADRLYVSLSTVKTHASNIFSKMDVQRRTQAVMLAQKTGIIPPSKV